MQFANLESELANCGFYDLGTFGMSIQVLGNLVRRQSLMFFNTFLLFFVIVTFEIGLNI